MNFLESVFSFLGGYQKTIQVYFLALFDMINYVAHFLYEFVSAVAGYVINALKAVGSFFRHLWDDFFSNIFGRIFRAVRDLADWLDRHLRPLIDWLQRAQRYIMHLYTLYVRPILVMIQRIRQVLTVLRALHIQWAQDLDNILAHVQSDINGIFLKITGTLNAVIDVLNIVTDPARLLRHPMLVLSVRRSILALIRQLTGLPPGFWIPSRRSGSPAGTTPLPRNFNPLDLAQNPPPSYYMGLPSPVPSLGDWSSGVELPDDYADDVAPLDFFAADQAPRRDCEDGAVCFLQAVADARARA